MRLAIILSRLNLDNFKKSKSGFGSEKKPGFCLLDWIFLFFRIKMVDMRELIKKSIREVILKSQKEKTIPVFENEGVKIDRPKDEKFGDYSANIALVLAGKVGGKPMEIAADLVKRFDLSRPKQPKEVEPRFADIFEKVEVVPPGYINFHLSKEYLQNKIAEINKEQEKFGKSEIGKGKKVNNEFISANPTGPLTVGNGRGGYYGDGISKILKKAGFNVTNEYYVNNTGEQIAKLGHSVLKDSEAVYQGRYIDELNKELGKGDAKKIGKRAAEIILEKYIKKTTEEKMKIKFDSWIFEENIYKKKYVNRAIDILKEKNITYEKDGALWLKTTEFEDDKDRVLIKSNGEKAYFASDCGYILNKIERGFDKIIEIWGADHHGYVSRFKAAAKALGFSGELKFIIVQLVKLVKDGREVRMSKRAGNVVYIDDLIKEVGNDAARFFFLMYSPDTHMNFDLGLAKERSEKNPVYYAQYAHARIHSILAKAKNAKRKTKNYGSLSLLTHEKELSLMKELNKFPELVEEIAQSYEVHKLPQYAVKLADKFHSFYGECRVIDGDNPELSKARHDLINAVRIVLAEALRLMGISAPERM